MDNEREAKPGVGMERINVVHGILNVYKERGYTSHDVVAKLRGMTHQRKIGHTGTLDPDAEGVLPVCLGKGTKVCGLLTDEDKTYEAVLLLGRSTDTQDISGKVLEEGRTELLQEAEVRKTILGFKGDYEQLPPMYSARKINGKKLYELARAGHVVERKPRKVRILDIQVLSVELPRVRMGVTCSKGTYIRTLCHDIGEKLGCHGCMESLKRTRVGQFLAGDSLTLSEIQKKIEDGELGSIVLPVDGLFAQYPSAVVSGKWENTAKNGGALKKAAICQGGGKVCRLYDEKGAFIALYQWEKEREEYRLLKMFFAG